MSFHGDLNYSRFYKLFPIPGTSFKDDVIERIANTKIPAMTSKNTKIPAGYTYFGQFIAHEISRLLRGDKIPTPGPAPTSDLVNLRSASFDLDCLYGSTQGFGPCIPNHKDKFTSASTFDQNKITIISDLPRANNGYALIGDSRNDENFLLAQLQVLLINAHNRLIDLYRAQNSKDTFGDARKELTLIFQKIIRDDFLKRILHPVVYDKLFVNKLNEYLINPTTSELTQIPIEFSGAAFRFGHSLIRQSYDICNNGVCKLENLETLFRLTGRGGGWRDIGSTGFLVNWPRLLDYSSYPGITVKFQEAEPFDISFMDAMRMLRNEHPHNNNIVVRNLKRGQEIGLPSGQDIVRHIKNKHPTYAGAMDLNYLNFKNIQNKNLRTMIRELQLDRKMPLWTYILTEPADNPEPHTKLGTLGSIIVGEVIRAILITSPISLYTESINDATSQLVQDMQSRFPTRNLTWNNLNLADLAVFVHSI